MLYILFECKHEKPLCDQKQEISGEKRLPRLKERKGNKKFRTLYPSFAHFFEIIARRGHLPTAKYFADRGNELRSDMAAASVIKAEEISFIFRFIVSHFIRPSLYIVPIECIPRVVFFIFIFINRLSAVGSTDVNWFETGALIKFVYKNFYQPSKQIHW